MIVTALRGVACRRPILTFTATTSGIGIGYLQFNSEKKPSSIPRNHYDAAAIEKYWSERPLSAVRRVVSIATELGPVACEYLYKFHVRPKLIGEPATAEEKEGEVRELSKKLRCVLTTLGPSFIKVSSFVLQSIRLVYCPS